MSSAPATNTPNPNALPAAIGFMGIALVSFAAMAISVRELTDTMRPFQILAFRSIFGVIVVPVLALAMGRLGEIRTGQFRLQLLRNTVHYGGQWFWAFGVASLPLATVFALEFTAPAWAALLAVLVLGERMNPGRVLSVVCGLLGVVVILRPGMESISLAAMSVLAAAFCYGVSHIGTKKLTRTDGVLAIVFWMSLLQLPMGLIPALYDWAPVAWSDMPAILSLGISALGAHYGLSNALRRADATVVIPLDFLRLPLIAVAGFLFYAEGLDPMVLIGGGIIFVGILLSLYFEQRARKPL